MNICLPMGRLPGMMLMKQDRRPRLKSNGGDVKLFLHASHWPKMLFVLLFLKFGLQLPTMSTYHSLNNRVALVDWRPPRTLMLLITALRLMMNRHRRGCTIPILRCHGNDFAG